MTTVFERFDIHYACWRNFGPCGADHVTHIHVSRNPDFNNKLPQCEGGSSGWEPPGSPGILELYGEVYRRFPAVHAPGPGMGIFNCRPIADTNPPQWSDHAYANALDISGTSSLLDDVWDWLNGQWEEENDMANYSEQIGLDDDTVGNALAFLAGARRNMAGDPKSSVLADKKMPKEKGQGWEAMELIKKLTK